MHANMKTGASRLRNKGREPLLQDLADFLLFPWPLCGDLNTLLLFPILFTPGKRPSSFVSGNLGTWKSIYTNST